MKYKNKLVLTLLVLVNSSVYADVDNGGFETWSNDLPSKWTTIDSGISVTENKNIVKTGLSSAAISVNTHSQSATDFQQLVAVEAGKTYLFSTWVYHTEGNIKTRLYVDGYQGYSNENLINQWQQVSFSYVASENKNIAVGLRFYDTAGFDGTEVVYIDDFQPSITEVPNQDSCASTEIKFSLTTDNYGYETSWIIKDSNSTEIAQGGDLSNDTTYNENLCLVDGEYSFTINDTYGDGICCTYGNGAYGISVSGLSLISGATFTNSETKTFKVGSSTGGGSGGNPGNYYASTTGKSGYVLKTTLHNIIKNHTAKGYSALWTFYESHSLDNYYEKDGSILDMYSEKPSGTESYIYEKVTNQCGNYSAEGGCYNREHSFPKSWFGGKIEPMNSDVHHIFATDGFVNSKRSGYPYGEVGSASFTSTNNSKLGSATASLGYTGTVFEPIDEFKGDLARAYLYMATRYEDIIATWTNESVYGAAILNATNDQVFKPWVITMLLRWHKNDPVSQKEIDRNEAAFDHQGNRNPFVDHPEFVDKIWSN
ncbi:endonuclease [Pseudoalteromonas sp. NBT06-2]|uniref:HNH endonuclease signature motif containing protein n=1 Tax=Pseudoalteromonas sp. NBT06-2 TaxID=2025950 RepID=UPI00207557B2|nr:endonuclease [Pseudoalteromonas sp. NBT06-2]